MNGLTRCCLSFILLNCFSFITNRHLKLLHSLREPFNALSHLLGVFLAVTALILLLNRYEPAVTPAHVIAFIIFAIAQVLMFSASTIYHSVPVQDSKLVVLRKIDHIMIFVSIAGSYTPICLITLKGGWGTSLLVIVWLIAIAGLFIKIFWLHAPRKLYTAIYLSMGWLVIVAIYPLYSNLPGGGWIWLGFEALFYTVGAVIYAMKKPDPLSGTIGFHGIFHIFILLGAISHFLLLYFYI